MLAADRLERPAVAGGSSRAARDAEDLTLVQRIAEGDREAFERLYRAYAPRLGRFLLRMVGSQDLAEEALNDTLLVVWQKAERFEPRARVSSWLYGIAHNKGLHALGRLRVRHRELPDDEHPRFVHAREDRGDPETSALWRDQLRRVMQAVEALPTEQRTVVELTFFEHRSYAEIAEILGCPENTVKTRMYYARRQLVQRLEALR